MPIQKPAKLALEEVAHDIIQHLVHRYREQPRREVKTGRLNGKGHDTKPLQEANSQSVLAELDTLRKRRSA